MGDLVGVGVGGGGENVFVCMWFFFIVFRVIRRRVLFFGYGRFFLFI